MADGIKKEKRFRFNLLDFVIILVLAVVLVYGVYSYTHGGEAEGEIKAIATLEVSQREEFMYSKLEEGQKVSDHVKNIYLGTLKSYEVKPSRVISENVQDGTFIMTELPNRFDALLNVEVTANVSGIDLILNKEPLKIGQLLTVRVGNTAFNTIVVGIDYDEAEYRRLTGDA